MAIDSRTTLRFRSYKPFDEQLQGFDRIAPVNVIIGRNNSGKSAVLDIVDYATAARDISANGHQGIEPSVEIQTTMSESEVERIFPKNTSGGVIGGNHFEYGRQWIDTPLTVALRSDGQLSYVSAEPEPHAEFRQLMAAEITNPFSGLLFKRILAERNIVPEVEKDVVLLGNGDGASNMIQHLLNESSAQASLVEDSLRSALNSIFAPDASFDRIQVKRLPNKAWEVYLYEEGKGAIALSDSGSGLKTILHVLLQLIVVPEIEQRDVSSYIFGFEELENNLHPGLQRRLFSYLRGRAVAEGLIFFITTHSNVVIDMFSNDAEAQIIHVSRSEEGAQIRTVSEYHDGVGVLDDLDVRASDLLQSNGIVWVEGPSDRIYVNHFLSTLYGDDIREGAHYQCVFYGGRLLARLTANPGANDLVNILRINRHCCLIMDRDTTTLNATKKRMKAEVKAVGGEVWVTANKEIECSIPLGAIKSYYGLEETAPLEPLEPFHEYLDKIIKGEGNKYLRNKVLYAESIVPHIDKRMIEADSKLMRELAAMRDQIQSWNKI